MFPNWGSWSTYPPQNLAYPQYQFGALHTAYDATTNVPDSTTHASGPSSPSVTTRLTANAREFAPAEMAGPAPVTPSPGFPLPKRSSAIKISNPNTGQAIVLGPPVPATVPRAVRVDQPTDRPLTKKERKRKAKLEAEEKQRAETEAKVRLWRENEEKRAKEKAEEVERIKMAEEEQRKREGEAEETWREAEEELRTLVEERRKAEEELMDAEEERRKAKEELRKLEEKHRIRRDKEEQARKEREEAEAKAEAEEEQKLRRLAEEAARFATKKQEKPSPVGLPASSPFPSAQRPPLTSNLDPKWASDWRETFDRVVYSERIQHPPAELDSGKPNEEWFRASQRELEQSSTFQAASSSLQLGTPPPPPLGQDSLIPRVNLPKGQLTSDNPAEEGQKDSGRTVADNANHHALNAILELSKQMEMILQEMKELKHEVRELRSAAGSGDRRERSKSPQHEISVPKAPKTATAINQYFVMKKGELEFCPGDVITILDAPQDAPRGWMYGEINVTKRGFFPASYVKLEQ
ncbi:hypothetical protein M407DRAFT_17750 [Tulasnella calospora MUT 4182]|uniref:SH3 domain-containing protein n=1 Tax=Tulasnella calospora MUT 4182 TaxID=1051891 RepID=A0A0C3MII3_9AGAM|nr:hypothetical protein M407DRAFT_17750 [Tulasnella calospora MUT 4182]